jgi:hypothetical protein
MDNRLSALIATIIICVSARRNVPAEVYHELHELETSGVDVGKHLKLITGRPIYPEYRDHTKHLRQGVVSLLVAKRKSNAPTKTQASDQTNGWRRVDSFVGLYFMQLNRELTSQLVSSLSQRWWHKWR